MDTERILLFTKLLALLVTVCVLVASSSAAIALDAYNAARVLSEQVFTLTPEEGVTVTLRGIMPSTGYAEAEPAEIEDEGVLHAYDITIRYADGAEFEPAPDAPVSVRFESAAIAEAIADKSTELSVEHITDSGETESVFLSVAEDDRVEFLAGSFSVYLIREEDGELKTPRKTFWYLDSNWAEYPDNSGNDNSAYYVSGLYQFPNTAGEMISAQTVKNGEKLHPIVLPANYDWGSFYGWYVVALDFEKSQAATVDDTGKPADEITKITDLTKFVYKWEDNPTLIMSDSTIDVTADRDEDVFLAPHYSKYRFVNFHEHIREGDEVSNIVARKLLVLGNNHSDTVDISDVAAKSPIPEHEIFFGWQYGNRTLQTRRATGDIIPQSITVTEADLNGGDSIDLYAVFRNACWIYFVQGERDWNARYLGAMFAYLYDETIADPESRVTITQLPTTTRPGYIFDGWYTGHLDGDDHIVYEQQVSMGLKDATVVGNSSIITTEGETITIGAQDTYIHMGKLYLKEELTLYAKWRPVNTADVKVVVWKQKVSDSKNARDDQKTYDYYDYRLLEDQETGSVALDSADYRDLNFEQLADSPDENTQAAFRGFHYDRTIVAVNNQRYDGNIPSERVNGVVAPDGSTVINVYYDRDLTAINFYYKKSDSNKAPANAVNNGNYLYTAGDPAANTQLFGIVNDQYVELNKSSTPESYYVYRYEYYPVENDDTGANRFGVAGDEYVQLTRNLIYNWTKTGTWYELTTERNTSKIYTGIKNGAFVSVSYTWFFGWRASGSSYNGNFYNVRTDGERTQFTGDRYVLSGSATAASTSTDPNVQYSRDSAGNLYELSRSDNGAEYLYNGGVYSGTRYERTEYRKTRCFEETFYKKTANGFEVTTDETGTLYALRGGRYEEIVRETKTVYTYTLKSDSTTAYEGPVYTRASSGKTGNNVYEKRLTWTGLYGQTFAQAGYSWSNVNGLKWTDLNNSSNTNQTLLDSFQQASNPYNLESNGATGNDEIRHYKQQVDGSYVNEPIVAKTSSSSGSVKFTFENKFYGFKVHAYSTNGFHSSDTDSGVTTINPGSSVDGLGLPLYVYHERVKNRILLVNYYSAEDASHAHQRDLELPTEIAYEANVSAAMENYKTPPERENYEFAGWYIDKGCTQRADIETMTMPAESMALYAKWDLKYYFVEIDPNGGEMEDQTEFSAYTGITSPRKQSTYTWLQYGQKIAEYANVERNYVHDERGEYVYVNVKFAPTFDVAKEKDWDLSLPSKYRAAFYCRESELQTVYNDHFSTLMDGNGNQLLTWENFKDYCVDKTHRYRRTDGNDGYTLAAWYKVNDDGTNSNEIYNFHDIVTKPTRIRAVWRKTGEYYVQYDPFMRGYNIGRVVEKDGQTFINTVTYDPPGANDPTLLIDKLTDSSEITIGAAPLHIPQNYTFKGWQLLDHDGNYADVDPLLVGQHYIINSDYADQYGAIRFEAVYEPEAASVRRVPTASLVLDAAGGRVQRNNLDIYEDAKIYVDLVEEQVLFKNQPNNFDVNLKDYYDNFLHDDGYVLIGWSKKPNPTVADIDFKADDIIGVDIENDENDILYAVWEPMYYLTLENHSTEYDVTFTLSFSSNGTDNHGKVYCYADHDNSGHHLYERHLLSECSHENMVVTKSADNLFTITMKKATTDGGGNVIPNSERLVLPEGATATYTVSGSVENVKQDESTSLKNTGMMLSVYNSGGASEKMTPVSQSPSGGVYQFRNLNNATTDDYSVTGSMKLGDEGQKIAFYTGNTKETSIYISSYYYVPGENKWQREDNTHSGPGATLNFVDINLGDGYSVVTHDGDQGIEGLSIIQGQSSTYGISQTYTNSTHYKFIGWYDYYEAAPRDVPIDGVGTNPHATITGLRVPNEPVKFYYALYVPLADGNLKISHDEKQSSIGYPKQMLVKAELNGTTQEQLITTEIYSIAARNGEKVHTSITVPVSESDTGNIVITLGAMSGYGCVYSNTYEGLDMLDRTETRSSSHYFEDGGIEKVVYNNPDDTKDYVEGMEIGNGETKHLYRHVITRPISELFEESETVKGYKILRNLQYTSDFERKYEFVYNYMFRDGTTQRHCVVTGSTAVYNSDDDFRAFVTKSAPYITNFGEDLTWDISSVKVDNLIGKGRVTATMNAVQPKKTAKVMVKTEGSAIEIPHQVAIGETFPDGQRPTAELIRNGTQFYRWEIVNTATKEFIGYCYWHEFTFRVWNDITITAQYVPLSDDGEYHRYYPDDETNSYITIQHLDFTRNRWVKVDENGAIIRTEKDLPETYYDNLFDDYSILFVDKGLRINLDPDNYKVGLIYEIVGEIENEEIPEAYSRTPNDELRMRAIQAVTNKGNNTNGTIKSGGNPKFYYSQFDPASLSNDNRMEFYRGIDNLKTEAGLNPNAKYVFDVYAYMKLPDGTIIQSERPITLQLYRLAVKETAQ